MKMIAALLVLTACSGELTPEGSHHDYVISSVRFPVNATEASTFAIAPEAGGSAQNAFGAAIAGAIPLQATTNLAITQGEALILLDLQARSFGEAAAAGVEVDLGGFPDPAACLGPDECGRHLAGNATFKVEKTADQVFGSVQKGTFLSLTGPFSIQLSLDGMRAFEVPVLAGRVQLGSISDSRIGTGIIAGAIDRGFLSSTFIDELTSGTTFVLARDCSACSCEAGSPGSALLVAFDTNHDCFVQRTEIMSAGSVQAMLRADLNVDGAPAVSFGMGIAGVSASFENN